MGSAELGVKCEAMRHRVIIISATPVRKEKPLNLSQLQNIYNERRRHVSDMCGKHKDDIEQEYKSMWKISGNASWENIIAKADVLEKSDQGFLWCKVPKAASES